MERRLITVSKSIDQTTRTPLGGVTLGGSRALRDTRGWWPGKDPRSLPWSCVGRAHFFERFYGVCCLCPKRTWMAYYMWGGFHPNAGAVYGSCWGENLPSKAQFCLFCPVSWGGFLPRVGVFSTPAVCVQSPAHELFCGQCITYSKCCQRPFAGSPILANL